MPRRILLINGPNLNLLGTREPHIYGSTTLADVLAQAQAQAAALGVELETFQSNHEGAIVDRIQEAAGLGPNAAAAAAATRDKDKDKDKDKDNDSDRGNDKVSAVIINPGAFTHTSVAIRDALLGVDVPFVEVHVTNVHAREAFRRHSYLSDRAAAVVAGLGTFGYAAALEFAAKHLEAEVGG